MPNRTIYVTAENNKQLNSQDNVSGLINTLLEDYFAKLDIEGQGKQ